MQQDRLAIQGFDPDVYIEIDDTATGARKLARVDETGHAYYDLHGDDATAFPIYEVLSPQEVGNILGWGLYLADRHPDEQPKFKVLVERLIASGQDPLTYNRAAHWAFINHNYDYESALAAGLAATRAVQAGRARMDAILIAAEGQSK